MSTKLKRSDVGFDLETTWGRPYIEGQRTAYYPDLVESLRNFLDKLAGAKPDLIRSQQLTELLESWTDEMSLFTVHETEQPFGRMTEVAGRAQAMTPRFVALEGDKDSVRGTVVFGRYFLGRNGAAHGGAVSLFFDEVMGRLQHTIFRPIARTAYLHVSFQAITPIDKSLDVVVWTVSEEGRKRLYKAEIRDGETLCATAEGLFITLRLGQP
jgi:acyl-coenzyme A thioesterase PaaI-like protein